MHYLPSVFTGLVEATGKLASRERRGPGARLFVETKLGERDALVLGESISVDGCCLTVDAIRAGGFEADASNETLRVTTLGAHTLGSRVNLERATQLGARMGGHIVSGHVDGTGALVSKDVAGEAWALRFSMPKSLARYVAQKGSITVSGISLTVNAVTDATFDVTIIPRTWRDTSLSELTLGGKVNLEVDLVARYLERLVTTADPTADQEWLSRLKRAGYM